MSKTALVLIADGVEEIEAITPSDVLERAGIDVTIAGVGGMDLMGGHKIPLRAECLLEDCGEILFDALIVPGGGRGAESLHKSDLVSSTVMRHFEGGRIIAGICAAPAIVLAPLGILSGKHATCYPGLERRFPHDVKHCETSVCVDGKIVTSRGPGTAMEFSMKLVELLVGATITIKLARTLLVH